LLEEDPLLVEPIALLAGKTEWQEPDPRDSELPAAVVHIQRLCSLGIMARHVVTTFLWEKLAPPTP
jgi:hypothetical protein